MSSIEVRWDPVVALGVVMMSCALPLGVFLKSGQMPAIVLAFSVVTFLSYLMSCTRHLLVQLMARAIWWQSLTFGALLGAKVTYEALTSPFGFSNSNNHLFITSMMYLVGSVMALGGARRAGLDHNSPHFRPRAYRASLMVALVMAMADAISLTFYGGLELTDSLPRAGFPVDALPLFAGGAAMGIAVWGLYRLKMWGLLFNTVANVTIAALALGGAFELPQFLAVGLAATALGQLLMLAPILRDVSSGARAEDAQDPAFACDETSVVFEDTSSAVVLEPMHHEVHRHA